MRRDLLSSIIAMFVLTAFLGVGYSLLMTGIGQVAFPGKANGSKVLVQSKTAGNTKVVGSSLIAQDFRVPLLHPNGKPVVGPNGPVMIVKRKYFQPRPSTATSYNAAGSSFTNLGPNSIVAEMTFKRSLRQYLRVESPYVPGLTAKRVPIDAVTSSASGIDPHISPANAQIQAHRISAVRRIPFPTVQKMIKENTQERFLGFLGEPGVNVLTLNLALDRHK
jgi:potassium-transporting ATPase KdpC subunit